MQYLTQTLCCLDCFPIHTVVVDESVCLICPLSSEARDYDWHTTCSAVQSVVAFHRGIIPTLDIEAEGDKVGRGEGGGRWDGFVGKEELQVGVGRDDWVVKASACHLPSHGTLRHCHI